MDIGLNMLIDEGQLNVVKFKELFDSMEWVRVPRILTQDHADYFYVGKIEDGDYYVKAVVRPSNIMQLSETWKQCFDQHGKRITAGYRGKRFDFGSTVEVRLSENIMDTIKEAAKDPAPIQVQELNWD